MTIKCCVCNLERVGGEWKRGGETQDPVSHTYCPACLDASLSACRAETGTPKAKAKVI